jgi:hypothetical protein
MSFDVPLFSLLSERTMPRADPKRPNRRLAIAWNTAQKKDPLLPEG